MLRASEKRAPLRNQTDPHAASVGKSRAAARRRKERRRSSSASDDDGGNPAKIARRRLEVERAKAFFPSRATTTAAAIKRDARAARPQ